MCVGLAWLSRMSVDASASASSWPAATIHAPTAPGFCSQPALPLVGHVDGLSRFGVGGECWVAPTVTIRLRVYLTGNAATSAELAIRGGAKRNPLVYAQWAPTRVRYYAGPACDH